MVGCHIISYIKIMDSYKAVSYVIRSSFYDLCIFILHYINQTIPQLAKYCSIDYNTAVLSYYSSCSIHTLKELEMFDQYAFSMLMVTMAYKRI